jgi:hypothetical protein
MGKEAYEVETYWRPGFFGEGRGKGDWSESDE